MEKEYIVKLTDEVDPTAFESFEEETGAEELIRCKNCRNKECEGREGKIVCGIDGSQHEPQWFCADGEPEE